MDLRLRTAPWQQRQKKSAFFCSSVRRNVYAYCIMPQVWKTFSTLNVIAQYQLSYILEKYEKKNFIMVLHVATKHW